MYKTNFDEFKHLWIEGQRQGFAGSLDKTEMPDGSSVVGLAENGLLYLDHWHGSDVGGGQTLIYKLEDFDRNTSWTWNPMHPLNVRGAAIARMGYSGSIVRRFTEEEMTVLSREYGNMSQSKIVWDFLMQNLRNVNENYPYRGQSEVKHDRVPSLTYNSHHNFVPFDSFKNLESQNRVAKGEEYICYNGIPVFAGNFDFCITKQNLEENPFFS